MNLTMDLHLRSEVKNECSCTFTPICAFMAWTWTLTSLFDLDYLVTWGHRKVTLTVKMTELYALPYRSLALHPPLSYVNQPAIMLQLVITHLSLMIFVWKDGLDKGRGTEEYKEVGWRGERGETPWRNTWSDGSVGQVVVAAQDYPLLHKPQCLLRSDSLLLHSEVSILPGFFLFLK